ncbi:MAG TPA: molybdopterin-guanine dinucleotide biosynthesis protein B [Dehalococcoidia bacterium]|nr:molybdopterin-guanine dinucleotide biosynthesis protein B [Dehalococcoidia bacterium]
MAAIIAIVGRSKTGKTTLVEKLVTILAGRGYRMATAKHVHHKLEFDKTGKDRWRHIDAGSKAVVFGSSDKVNMIQPVKDALNLDSMLRLLGEDYDLIIVEAFIKTGLRFSLRKQKTGAT